MYWSGSDIPACSVEAYEGHSLMEEGFSLHSISNRIKRVLFLLLTDILT